MSQRNNYISMRASTTERMLMESLMVQMKVDKKSELIRSLIQDRAASLGLAATQPIRADAKSSSAKTPPS